MADSQYREEEDDEEEEEEEEEGEEDDRGLDEMGYDQIFKQTNGMEKKNDFLEGEIRIMKDFLDGIYNVQSIPELDEITESDLIHFRLGWDKRMEVVEKLLDDVGKERKKALVQAELKVEYAMKVRVESLKEAKKLALNDQTEFQRFLVRGRDGQLKAEKIEKYLEISLKQKKAEVDRLRKKIRKQRTSNRKLQKRVSRTVQMNEKHSMIDFDQLRIENSQMRQREKDLNEEIYKFKLSTGKTQQVLTSLMELLSQLQSNQKKLVQLIKARDKKIKSNDKHIQAEEREKRKHELKNKRLKKHHEELKVPEVLEYVKVKSDLDLLRKEVVNWNRKVSIAKMNENLYSVKLKKLLRLAHKRMII